MKGSPTTVVYTARSQFWVGDTFFKPIDLGGRAIEEGDPVLRTHADMFTPYAPKVRNYPGRKAEGREELADGRR